MTIEKKKPTNFRFKLRDLRKWKANAAKYNVTLTEYLETKANTNNDKHLFI